jgi:hypothetical protein
MQVPLTVWVPGNTPGDHSIIGGSSSGVPNGSSLFRPGSKS